MSQGTHHREVWEERCFCVSGARAEIKLCSPRVDRSNTCVLIKSSLISDLCCRAAYAAVKFASDPKFIMKFRST